MPDPDRDAELLEHGEVLLDRPDHTVMVVQREQVPAEHTLVVLEVGPAGQRRIVQLDLDPDRPARG